MIVEISVKSSKRAEMIDVTEAVQQAVTKSKVKEGICVLYCPHTTAAVIVNENYDETVQQDILSTLNRLVPEDAGYAHTEGNAFAHIKGAIVGNSRTVLIGQGKLLLGQWEGIFFCEFFGPRSRKLLVSIK